MDQEAALPKRLVNYIHDIGVRALDHLADNESGERPKAVQALVDDWKAMTRADKQQFVDRVAASVVDVIAASALLPVGQRLVKKAAKSARKAIKRRAKALKKTAKKLVRAETKAKKKTKKKKNNQSRARRTRGGSIHSRRARSSSMATP